MQGFAFTDINFCARWPHYELYLILMAGYQTSLGSMEQRRLRQVGFYLRTSGGFTFIAALMMVMVMGLMMGMAGQTWKQVMIREREEELMFRGAQYRDALEKWYKTSPGPGLHGGMVLNDLKDLLQDPHSPGKTRYLRKLYKDPITGKDFDVLRQPGRGIVGVFSRSEDKPIKQGNFPEDFKEFEGQDQYKKWIFSVRQQQQ